MDSLLRKLKHDFPDIVFEPGNMFSWSPAHKRVIYLTQPENEAQATWSLLHELGHAVLDHTTYHSDLELLKLEAAAWEQAAKLAPKYNLTIDGDHIQDCLDSYRDWLYQRSKCPTCSTICVQQNTTTYHCHNCQTTWRVSRSQLCRPYRRKAPSPT